MVLTLAKLYNDLWCFGILKVIKVSRKMHPIFYYGLFWDVSRQGLVLCGKQLIDNSMDNSFWKKKFATQGYVSF